MLCFSFTIPNRGLLSHAGKEFISEAIPIRNFQLLELKLSLFVLLWLRLLRYIVPPDFKCAPMGFDAQPVTRDQHNWPGVSRRQG